jgi:diaminohydroxyphosphoribosylaminopyrimidine deaminase / 5-amino-6-(5-phosphoribosylamino)uracil reductase
MKTEDATFMELALREAAKGVGRTRPNPPVGAVVVKSGKVIATGYHAKAGGPHAEVAALRAAGKRARGATLYVTLEPCCTQGRTPPCTEAIIKTKIARVVYGCVDPNPSHAGRADNVLRKVGIVVTRNVEHAACESLIRPFATRLLQQRPHVVLKLACSLDGRIADFEGQSKWITGAAARREVQDLRRASDAIMVGAETVRADDPSLLPRPARGRKPFRVVVKGKRPLPKQAKLFTDAFAERTLVYEAKLGLTKVLNDLAARDCMQLLCEGGGVLAEALLREDVLDEVWMFYAPKILGGGGRPAVAGKGWRLAEAPGFEVHEVKRVGEDVLVKLNRSRG